MGIQVSIERKTIWQLAEWRIDTPRTSPDAQAANINRDSLWIHAVLCGYPIPMVYAEQDLDTQKITPFTQQELIQTIHEYMNNQFALSYTTPEIEGEAVGGCRYKDLSASLQAQFEEAEIPILFFESENTMESIEAKFLLGCYPELDVEAFMNRLSKMDAEDFVKEMANRLFFSECVNMTETSKKRRRTQDVVIETMYVLAQGGAADLRVRTLNRYIDHLKTEGVPEALKKMMLGLTEYMTKAFPWNEIFLRSINIPILFMVATMAVAQRIPPEQFGGWAEMFFKNSGYRKSAYHKACEGSGTSKEQVATRLNELTRDFMANIYNAAPRNRVYTEVDGKFYEGEEVTATRVNPETGSKPRKKIQSA